jgi:hypothetical protein
MEYEIEIDSQTGEIEIGIRHPCGCLTNRQRAWVKPNSTELGGSLDDSPCMGCEEV